MGRGGRGIVQGQGMETTVTTTLYVAMLTTNYKGGTSSPIFAKSGARAPMCRTGLSTVGSSTCTSMSGLSLRPKACVSMVKETSSAPC